MQIAYIANQTVYVLLPQVGSVCQSSTLWFRNVYKHVQFNTQFCVYQIRLTIVT